MYKKDPPPPLFFFLSVTETISPNKYKSENTSVFFCHFPTLPKLTVLYFVDKAGTRAQVACWRPGRSKADYC